MASSIPEAPLITPLMRILVSTIVGERDLQEVVAQGYTHWQVTSALSASLEAE